MYNAKLILLVILSAFIIQTVPLAQITPKWITESNKHTQILLDIMAKFNPEAAARYGIDGIDEQIFDLNPGFNERNKIAYQEAKVELLKRLEVAKINEVKQDLQILITAVDEQLENTRLEEKYFLPYFNLSQIIFYSMKALLDDQIEESRRPAALVRLKKYTGKTKGFTPVTKRAQDYLESKLANKKLLGSC